MGSGQKTASKCLLNHAGPNRRGRAKSITYCFRCVYWIEKSRLKTRYRRAASLDASGLTPTPYAGVSYAFASFRGRINLKRLTRTLSTTGPLTGTTVLMLPIAQVIEDASDFSLSLTNIAAIVYTSV